jgi:hypothetical protein
MRGRDEGFDFSCGVADRVAQFAHGGGERLARPFGFFAQFFDRGFSCGWHRLIFPAQQKCRGTGSSRASLFGSELGDDELRAAILQLS